MTIDPKKEKAIIDECIRLGEQLPDRIANAPEIPEYMNLYFEAFFDLTTDRSFGMGEGPIPHSAIVQYCDRLNLNYDEEKDFVYFIRSMDNAYLEYREKQAKKKNG